MADLDINCVLLLEDEPFIAIDLEDTLLSAGVQRVVTMDSIALAGAWLEIDTPDLAIVDQRLRDGFCTQVVKELIERKVPFILYSGDPEATIAVEPAFGAGRWLSKPCQPDALIAMASESIADARRSATVR